jgi:hypothetical protein
MARYHFFTLDVFTGRRFGGNPLAVVLDAERLSGEQMQAIGRESVPVVLRAAAEFTRLCPDSAVCMTKFL